VTFSASKSGIGGEVEIRLGSPSGRLIGTFFPQDTGGWSTYREQLVQLGSFVSGVQDLYLVATGGTGVCNLESFRFSQYVLTWGDEFGGNSLNTNNWAAVDNGDVANGELQFYTPRTNNVRVANGVLQLTAQREAYTGQGPWMSAPKTTAYTSGLVESLNKVQPQYGKIEASMKIPRGAGLWPAFWMMGANYFTPGVGWPLCGEIDIMEYSGNSGGFTAAFHTGAYNYMNGGGGIQNVQGFSLGDYDTAFHVYGIEWTPTRVAFYVDGKVILEAKKSQMGSSTAQWPFDQPFWLKVNLAIGGPYGGDPSSGSFPKTMEVDWVRVYQEQVDN
jgi:beta-glucanase (GH16 family)